MPQIAEANTKLGELHKALRDLGEDPIYQATVRREMRTRRHLDGYPIDLGLGFAFPEPVAAVGETAFTSSRKERMKSSGKDESPIAFTISSLDWPTDMDVST
ncbi:hypothetical protein KJ359_001794 [Pestalotiopsis sp. 9143b]|nr:hypothetical protein KJ359_001794 [Pestalotiopsis sp. 9143b]